MKGDPLGSWLDQLEAPDARRWEFEDDGDTLVGEVVGLGEYTGEYGTSRTVTILPDVENTLEKGERVQAGEPLIFYASAKIAADELDAKDPRVGDELGIAYKGEKSSKDGKNTYKVFRMAIKRNSAVASELKQDAGQADW